MLPIVGHQLLCMCRDIAIIWNTNINNNENYIGSKPLHANISILVSGLASFDSISDMLSLLSLSLPVTPVQAVLYNIIFAASVHINHRFVYIYIYVYMYKTKLVINHISAVDHSIKYLVG